MREPNASLGGGGISALRVERRWNSLSSTRWQTNAASPTDYYSPSPMGAARAWGGFSGWG